MYDSFYMFKHIYAHIINKYRDTKSKIQENQTCYNTVDYWPGVRVVLV